MKKMPVLVKQYMVKKISIFWRDRKKISGKKSSYFFFKNSCPKTCPIHLKIAPKVSKKCQNRELKCTNLKIEQMLKIEGLGKP